MNVFTYGSLMFKDIWQDVTRENNEQLAATILGFSRVFIEGDVYPVLKPTSPTESLTGVMYTNVSHAAIKRLDVFEGEYYQRIKAKVKLENTTESHEAEVFVLKSKFQHLASSRNWSPDVFVAEHKDHFVRNYCTDT